MDELVDGFGKPTMIPRTGSIPEDIASFRCIHDQTWHIGSDGTITDLTLKSPRRRESGVSTSHRDADMHNALHSHLVQKQCVGLSAYQPVELQTQSGTALAHPVAALRHPT